MTSLYVFIPQTWQWVVILILIIFVLQIQPGEIPPTAGLFHLVNAIQDDNNALFPIGWSFDVVAGLNTFHPD